MTCVIGYIDKKNNAVYIGADSAGSVGSRLINRKDSKVFARTNPYGNDMIIGFTGSYRMGQLLRYKLIVPFHKPNLDTYEYMCTLFIDEVRTMLKNEGFTKITNNQEEIGKFLVAYKQRLFVVDYDLQVGENHANYDACGSGEDFAFGCLRALDFYSKEQYTGEEIIKIALQVAEDYCTSVRKPFVVLKLTEDNNVNPSNKMSSL